jgi:hypothetical protein
MEIGAAQKEEVEKLLKQRGLKGTFLRDDAGLWRAFSTGI